LLSGPRDRASDLKGSRWRDFCCGQGRCRYAGGSEPLRHVGRVEADEPADTQGCHPPFSDLGRFLSRHRPGPRSRGGSPWTRWCRQGGSVSSSRPTGMASRGSTASPTCVLQALRDRLRCKEIWVQGADRWRNPDDDLPKDFEASLAQHYQHLGQPLDPTEFVERLRHERLERALGGRCPPWPHPPTNEDLVPADSATTMSRCGPCGGRKPT
jgi:hypothetical protein